MCSFEPEVLFNPRVILDLIHNTVKNILSKMQFSFYEYDELFTIVWRYPDTVLET